MYILRKYRFTWPYICLKDSILLICLGFWLVSFGTDEARRRWAEKTSRPMPATEPLARRPMPGAISGAIVLIVALVALGLALSFIGRSTQLQAVAMALVVGAVIALAYKYA